MPRLVRKDDPLIAIIGICDMIPAVALISQVTSLDDIDYAGESRVDWDAQTNIRRNGLRVFIDENDNEVLEDQVLLVADNDD